MEWVNAAIQGILAGGFFQDALKASTGRATR